MSVPVLSWLFVVQGQSAPFQPAHGRVRSSVRTRSHATAPAFRMQTPTPNPQSQSFSRSYGSILPTSLTYIVLSTRGCSPWRPDAVMSTTRQDRYPLLQFFTGRQERTGHCEKCSAFPAAGPLLRLNRFQGWKAVKKKRELFPGLPPASPDSLPSPSAALSWFGNINPIPFRWSTPQVRP